MDFSELLARMQLGEHAVEASALVPHEAPLRGRVVRCAADGVDVRFATSVTLSIGERVRLELSLDGAPRAVVVRALVAARHELDERLFHFRLLTRHEIDAAMGHGDPPASRRRSQRFQLAAPLRVGLCDADAPGSPPRAYAMLDGASRDGCSLLVEFDTERMFAASERIVLEVRHALKPDASGTTRVWRIAARITDRQLSDDDDVAYGCRLEPAAGHEADSRQLVDYLLDRELDGRAAEIG